MADRRWQMVTCVDCGRTYRCVPLDDYYNETEAGGDGCCFDCLLARDGLRRASEPGGPVDT